jgi:hypothetical protein
MATPPTPRCCCLPPPPSLLQVSPDGGPSLTKGAARIQVDVLPLPDGQKATAVNYFRCVRECVVVWGGLRLTSVTCASRHPASECSKLTLLLRLHAALANALLQDQHAVAGEPRQPPATRQAALRGPLAAGVQCAALDGCETLLQCICSACSVCERPSLQPGGVSGSGGCWQLGMQQGVLACCVPRVTLQHLAWRTASSRSN